MRRLHLITVALIVILVAIGATGLVIVKNRQPSQNTQTEIDVKVRKIQDGQLGVTFNLPEVYQSRPDTLPTNDQKNALPAKNFERTSPQGFLTLRYEMGLGATANLARRSVAEHIEAEIRQFFKFRYKNYKDISLQPGQIEGKPSIEHIFEYEDKDGKPLKAQLIAVPYDNDSAYYIILQSHKDLFDQVVKDLPTIRESLKLNAPVGT